VEAQHPGSPEIYDEFKLRWLHYRKVASLLALEDSVDIARRQTVLIEFIGSITHQPASFDEVAVGINRGKSVERREIDDQLPIDDGQRSRHEDQRSIRPLGECGDNTFDLAGITYAKRAHLHIQRRRCALDCGQQADPTGIAWIAEHPGSRRAW